MMRIGILGGGQLARMMVHAGEPLDCQFVIYTPEVVESTRELAEQVIGSYTDKSKINEFLDKVDVVTFENENIPVDILEYIASRKKTYPEAVILKQTQDRALEKKLFVELGIPTNENYCVDTIDDLKNAAEKLGFPFVLKTRREGYDGKGQTILRSDADVVAFDPAAVKNSIAEKFVVFDREVSVIGVRNVEGDIKFYDLCENKHEQGILISTKNKKDDPLQEQACNYLQRVMQHFNYVGVMAFEFFVQDGQLFANEIAPRVHNSGHWTIEGAVSSQFENHVRAVAEMPLGSTESNGLSIMLNCIGSMPDKEKISKVANAHYHDYLKEPRAKRKLGHVTVTDCDDERNIDLGILQHD